MTTAKKIKYFLLGMGSVLDLSGTYFRPRKSVFKHSYNYMNGSIYDDWLNVGNDLKKTFAKTHSENKSFVH